MARRTSSRTDDDEVLDPIEAADVDDEGEVDDVDDVEAELEDVDDAVLDDDDAELDTDEPDAFVVDEEDAPTDDEAAVASLAVFDEEDEEITRVVVDDDDDDGHEIDGLREGEFICRSCFMAKRESALADPKRLLCRDCA